MMYDRQGCVSTLALSWRIFSCKIGAKYRKSFLGYLWMIGPAILITGGVSLADKSGIITPGYTHVPYPLFVFVGVLIWQVFAEAVLIPHLAFEGARAYLTKVHFAHDAIVLAQLYESVVSTGVRYAATLAMMAWYGGLGWRSVAVLALCLAAAELLGLGVGALLMPFTILFADMHNALRLVLTYGIFLTPAFFVPGTSGILSGIIRISPITPLMVSVREATIDVALSQPGALLCVLAVAIAATIAGMTMIRLSAPIVIERMMVEGR